MTQLSQDEKLSANTMQEILAIHLFMPLSMEKSSVGVDCGRYKGNTGTKCKYCSTKLPTANVSFVKFKRKENKKKNG